MSTRKKRRPYNVNPSVLLQDDDYLNVMQAVAWIKESYGLEITRCTLYRWIRVGRMGARWRGKTRRRIFADKVCGQIVLKKEYINNFIMEVSECKQRRYGTSR